MENANDDIFNIRYNEKLDRIEGKKRKSKINRYVSKNKFILSVIATFLFFSWFNIILIYKFYKIVELFN